MTLLNVLAKAMEECKVGFHEGYNKGFDKATKGKYEMEDDCMKKTKMAFKDATANLTINEDKLLDRSYIAMFVLGVLGIADIAHYGFKEHMKRAYTNPVKQFLIGLVIELLIILSCIEKEDK